MSDASFEIRTNIMFIYWSESEKCEFILLQYLLTYFKRVKIPLFELHPFWE